MPELLCIETATEICSVALANEKDLTAKKESSKKNSHAELVSVYIEELLKEYPIDKDQLDAVVVSKGPGSYTGLRIGVSTAKGLCYALDKPLIAINTLEAMASGMIGSLKKKRFDNCLFCPMIDARRMEVYAAVFDHNGNQVRETRAEIIGDESFRQELAENKVIFFGNGADKCKGVIKNTNAVFVDNFTPSAAYLVSPALKKFEHNKFENVAYFEPFYLKDFIAGIPKVKGLK